MSKAPKPVDVISSHLTKEEIANRKEAEAKLKGRSDLVYKIPKSLSKIEKKVYKFLIEELRASDILTNLDSEILIITTDSIIKMEECRKIINELGVVITKSDGGVYKNPAQAVYKEYFAIYSKCMLELPLSPSSRARLGNINLNNEKDKKDPLLNAVNKNKKE